MFVNCIKKKKCLSSSTLFEPFLSTQTAEVIILTRDTLSSQNTGTLTNYTRFLGGGGDIAKLPSVYMEHQQHAKYSIVFSCLFLMNILVSNVRTQSCHRDLHFKLNCDPAMMVQYHCAHRDLSPDTSS